MLDLDNLLGQCIQPFSLFAKPIKAYRRNASGQPPQHTRDCLVQRSTTCSHHIAALDQHASQAVNLRRVELHPLPHPIQRQNSLLRFGLYGNFACWVSA
jgi:hypothetical protein